MAWADGSKTIKFLLGKGKLDTTDAGAVAGARDAQLARADRKLGSARAVSKHDPESAYSLAYDSYRITAEALLAAQALRATGGEGGHVTVEDAVSAQFATLIPAFERPTFDRMRRTRHSVQYFDPAAVDINALDAAWAIEKAAGALAGARALVESGSLTPWAKG